MGGPEEGENGGSLEEESAVRMPCPIEGHPIEGIGAATGCPVERCPIEGGPVTDAPEEGPLAGPREGAPCPVETSPTVEAPIKGSPVEALPCPVDDGLSKVTPIVGGLVEDSS